MKKISLARIQIPKRKGTVFHALIRSIIYQQLSGKAAGTILSRFLLLFPKQSPTPEAIAALSDSDFKSVGVSAQKMSYLRDLAAKYKDGTINSKKFPTMSDEDIRQHLIAVKGIGRWTADMFLIFTLNRSNVLPVGDLGVQNGFKIVFNLRTRPNEKKMYALAKPYEGNWTKLSLYMWQQADMKKTP